MSTHLLSSPIQICIFQCFAIPVYSCTFHNYRIYVIYLKIFCSPVFGCEKIQSTEPLQINSIKVDFITNEQLNNTLTCACGRRPYPDGISTSCLGTALLSTVAYLIARVTCKVTPGAVVPWASSYDSAMARNNQAGTLQDYRARSEGQSLMWGCYELQVDSSSHRYVKSHVEFRVTF